MLGRTGLRVSEFARLDEVSRIDLGFPYDFPGRAPAYGDTFDGGSHHRRDVYTAAARRPEGAQRTAPAAG